MPDIIVGPVTVPNVVGLDLGTAEVLLSAQYLTAVPDGEIANATYALGIIVSQFPSANTDVNPVTDPNVNLTLSLGGGLYRNYITERRRVGRGR